MGGLIELSLIGQLVIPTSFWMAVAGICWCDKSFWRNLKIITFRATINTGDSIENCDHFEGSTETMQHISHNLINLERFEIASNDCSMYMLLFHIMISQGKIFGSMSKSKLQTIHFGYNALSVAEFNRYLQDDRFRDKFSYPYTYNPVYIVLTILNKQDIIFDISELCMDVRFICDYLWNLRSSKVGSLMLHEIRQVWKQILFSSNLSKINDQYTNYNYCNLQMLKLCTFSINTGHVFDRQKRDDYLCHSYLPF